MLHKAKDLLENLPFDAPQNLMVEAKIFVWSPDSSKVLYVCKKKSGKIMQPAPIQIFTFMI